MIQNTDISKQFLSLELLPFYSVDIITEVKCYFLKNAILPLMDKKDTRVSYTLKWLKKQWKNQQFPMIIQFELLVK